LSLRYADTGVSRSAAMSNGGFKQQLLVSDLVARSPGGRR
jgi:hypothetical protein